MCRLNRLRQATLCLLVWVCAHPGAAGAQTSGVIEFHDEAPPATDADKQTAQIYAARAAVLAQNVQRLATAMKATWALQSALAAPVADGGGTVDNLAAPMSAWKASWAAMITPGANGGPTTLHPDAIPAYVSASLQLVAASSAQRPTDLGTSVRQAFALQSKVLDDMIAEHAVLNLALRYYPYDIVPQTPLACPLVNRYSRDFRCFTAAELAMPQTDGWLFDTPFMRNDYCVASGGESFAKDQAGVLTMLVRNASFDDHVLDGGTAGAVVKAPHARATLLPAC